MLKATSSTAKLSNNKKNSLKMIFPAGLFIIQNNLLLSKHSSEQSHVWNNITYTEKCFI